MSLPRFQSLAAVLLSALLMSSPDGLHAQVKSAGRPDNGEAVQQTTVDVSTKYTTVGNVLMTITNYGTIGSRNFNWRSQPSCEYPKGSRIQHLYQGGLWVGALMKTGNPADRRNDQFLVTTATSDQVNSSRGNVRGFEFNANLADSINELSSLSNDRPSTSQYSPLAVSHQDFIADYSDLQTRVPTTGDSIIDHQPLGIKIRQESYAWNLPFADFFVILKYTITNVSQADTLDSLYVGMWANAVVRNWNFAPPGTPGYYNYTGQGFDSVQRMAYSFDFSGAPFPPAANSYVGIKLLGVTPFPVGVDSIGDLFRKTYYNAWQYQLSSGDDWFLSPTDDYNANRYLSRYTRMSTPMPPEKYAPLRTLPQNVSYLLSTGSFPRLLPGKSMEVVYAVVCARKFGKEDPSKDLPAQRKTLYANADWAQHTYQGEDVNGNNILDAGEDIARRDSVSPTETGLRYEPDGLITRYLLPAPPRKPKVRAVVENNAAVIYWDKSTSEESVDPITAKKDFEGYRIYRTNAGDDYTFHESFITGAPLVAEFDVAGDGVGYETGFSQILLPAPRHFNDGDTTSYYYRYPPPGSTTPMLNGFQYVYAISAFDQGDSAGNVPILESTRAIYRLIPGTAPHSGGGNDVFVYPNPYYVNAVWDGSKERLRKIYFANLPARCQIIVYTLAGDVVAVLDHDAATYHGQGIQWFDAYGDPSTTPAMSGGEHAWDLITRNDQAIATGLYLFAVKDEATGDVKRGKFLIIK